MSRNRVIYQSQAVYAGPDKDPNSKDWRHETGNEAPSQLQRVQSANYSFDIARQDVNQYGDLAAIDRVILESPTVSLDFSWYLCSFYNEDKLGFFVNGAPTAYASLKSCLTDVLKKTADERNYYVRIVPDGQDAAGFSGATTGTAVKQVDSWALTDTTGGNTWNVTVAGTTVGAVTFVTDIETTIAAIKVVIDASDARDNVDVTVTSTKLILTAKTAGIGFTSAIAVGGSAVATKDAVGSGSVLNDEAIDSVESNVIGVGNGFMSSYTSEGAVGGFPTSSLTVEALNMAFAQGSGGLSPHVQPADGSKNATYKYGLPEATSRTGAGIVTALKPGDVTLNLPDVDGAANDAKVQNYNLSFDLAREPLSKLGSRFAFAREITFPITVTMSIDALVGDLTTGNLADIICADEDYDLTVDLKKPAAGCTSAEHIAFNMKKAKLDSQSFTSTIGDNESVTLTFSAQIGSESQSDVGLFMSGATA